jgi:hypothetical protein
MRRAAVALALVLAGCGGGSPPHTSCAGRPTRPADPAALGFASLARQRDEGFIQRFALLARARPDATMWSLDGGRACVRFSGDPPHVRMTWETRDRTLAGHLRDEVQAEALTP